MALKIDELLIRAKEYVELEADTKVLGVEVIAQMSFIGQDDAVMLAKTNDSAVPEWWVVGGDSPLNLYNKTKFNTADEVFSMHVGLVLRMWERSQESKMDGEAEFGYDAFICHASEDKDDLVRPLAHELRKMGYRIWYDEFELKVGDSLRHSIDRGLANSSYGIVVLSDSFFNKNWTQYELDGLVAREIEGEKVILPIWHGIDKNDVAKYSPSLADKKASESPKHDARQIAQELSEVLGDTSLAKREALRETPSLQKAEAIYRRDADERLFIEFLETLPYKGSISFIDKHNMAGSFEIDQLRDADEFLENWRDAEHEFLDETLDSMCNKLYESLDTYRQLISTETFPMDSGWQSVPIEWEIEQPQRFRTVVNKLNIFAGEIVHQHQEMVRYGRRKFRI